MSCRRRTFFNLCMFKTGSTYSLVIGNFANRSETKHKKSGGRSPKSRQVGENAKKCAKSRQKYPKVKK